MSMPTSYVQAAAANSVAIVHHDNVWHQHAPPISPDSTNNKQSIGTQYSWTQRGSGDSLTEDKQSDWCDQRQHVDNNDMTLSSDEILNSKKRNSINTPSCNEVDVFSIYKSPVAPALQRAYDCIHGLPFRGSMAFAARLGSPEQVHSVISPRFCGSADVRVSFDVSAAQDASEQLRVRALSCGYDDGNNAHLVLNGVDYCLNRRGLNLALIDPSTHHVKVASFDTHLFCHHENTRLQDFIGSACCKIGFILLASVKDDASACLSLDSMDALRSVGILLPLADDVTTLKTACIPALPAAKTTQLLNVCAKANAVKCIELLCVNGWDINARSRHDFHNTALHDATRRNHLDIIRVLLRLGADRNIRNREGLTADDMALKLHNHRSLEEMIVSHQSHETQLLDSVLRALDL